MSHDHEHDHDHAGDDGHGDDHHPGHHHHAAPLGPKVRGHGIARRRILAAGAALPVALTGGRASAQRFVGAVGARAAAFAATLDANQRRSAVYPFDGQTRFDWHYVPRSRPGLPFKAMNARQREAAQALLRTVLSDEGYQRIESIRLILENILRGDSSSSFRDPDNYALALFGAPDAFPWGFRFEGHHLSLNFTFPAPDKASATPAFWGANPAEVRRGQNQGFRLLGAQTDAAFALLRSLDAAQRGEAVIGDRSLGDIVAGPGRGDELRQPRGVAYARLADAQRNQVIAIVEGMMGMLNAELRALQDKRLREAGLDALRFAWAGAMESGRPYYFRLHGPITLVEFDNTQDDANHIHSLWRDLASDWGDDALGAHYQSGHKP